jgi:type IV secretion system pilin
MRFFSKQVYFFILLFIGSIIFFLLQYTVYADWTPYQPITFCTTNASCPGNSSGNATCQKGNGFVSGNYCPSNNPNCMICYTAGSSGPTPTSCDPSKGASACPSGQYCGGITGNTCVPIPSSLPKNPQSCTQSPFANVHCDQCLPQLNGYPNYTCPRGTTCSGDRRDGQDYCFVPIDFSHPALGGLCDDSKQSDPNFKCPANSFCESNGNDDTFCKQPSIQCAPPSSQYDGFADDGQAYCRGYNQLKTCDPAAPCRSDIPGYNPAKCCPSGQLCQLQGTIYACTQPTPTPNYVNHCPNGQCPTSLGNINTSASGFINFLFRLLLSISGAIALLIIIISGYNYALSGGNPEKVKAARETLTAAIVGLLFIIFSTVILQIIGINVLGLSGFVQ